MAAGELSAVERRVLDEAIRKAEQTSRYEFSVFVGRAEGEPRAFAIRLHQALVAPDRSILVLVDPVARVLEIVTGADARRTLADSETELIALSMQNSFAAGDLVGGLKHGVQMLAEHARAPQMLHAE